MWCRPKEGTQSRERPLHSCSSHMSFPTLFIDLNLLSSGYGCRSALQCRFRTRLNVDRGFVIEGSCHEDEAIRTNTVIPLSCTMCSHIPSIILNVLSHLIPSTIVRMLLLLSSVHMRKLRGRVSYCLRLHR